MHTAAIGSGSVTGLSVAIVIGLLVVGLLLGVVITKLIARFVIAVVVIALAILVWVQRDQVRDKVDEQRCDLNASFFGIDVQPSDDVKRDCARSDG